MDGAPGEFATLQRLLRKPAPQAPGERCDYCGVPVAPEHGHLIDMHARRILCACRPCALVFEPDGAANGRYKAVPTRYAEIPAFALDDAGWERLQIPIGLAFFFTNSAEARTIALYPGPAGATESQLDLSAWNDVVAAHPLLGALQPDVEAALVLRRDGATKCFVVPIDAAYKLVGIMRLSWKGFDGGPDAWARIDAFFGEIAQLASRTVAHGIRT
ncbi:MAG TPA: DUF5947 family protein [Candidatus Elarobacter sp.]|nr:DUF5947 family protein [Candidatus Elarobacter sp.]